MQMRGAATLVPANASVRVTGGACPAGSVPTSGGHDWVGTYVNASVVESQAVGRSWQMVFRNNSGRSDRVSVITHCVTGG
ncbi:hypothetical protein [Nonomuraea candida]|uniref:hypothetical protein n=1 Tax=Nonomuraea candida TaxID=359159 RepID=UPI001FDF36A4|nr:hypothetical protein [Nonomuraea candida]